MTKQIKVNLPLKNVAIKQILYSNSIQNANSTWVKVNLRMQDQDLKK